MPRRIFSNIISVTWMNIRILSNAGSSCRRICDTFVVVDSQVGLPRALAGYITESGMVSRNGSTIA